MKRILLVSAAVTFCILIAAQTPESFTYQVIVRDASNNPITNQDVSFRMSIHQGSSSGPVQYSELHSANTGDLGMVNLMIGSGSGKTGNFATIDWGSDTYFLSVEIDETGGSSYELMGTIQMLSVPYSLYSKTAGRMLLRSLTSTEILGLTPEKGQMVYNTTIDKILVYNGSAWSAIAQDCWPPADLTVNAGSDQTSSSGNLVLTLDGSSPTLGTGAWSIVSGTGGSFEDINSPSSLFYADLYIEYQLRWSVTTLCGTTSDEMNITPEALPYSHTINIDGTNDFVDADEKFSTTSIGYNAYYAWDNTYLYLGFKGADINSGSTTKYLILYISGSAGTTDGMTINTQQPVLPFSSKYCILWRASGNFFQGFSFNGSSWQTDAIVGPSDIARTGDFIEMRIPLALVGSPTNPGVHVNMINESAGSEWTYAGAPSNSFSDGYDPNYLHYYVFVFTGVAKPVEYSPLP